MHCRKEVSMSRYSAQQSSISENNRSRILQYLYHNGICSRAQIAKAIKLTPAAITKSPRNCWRRASSTKPATWTEARTAVPSA